MGSNTAGVLELAIRSEREIGGGKRVPCLECPIVSSLRLIKVAVCRCLFMLFVEIPQPWASK